MGGLMTHVTRYEFLELAKQFDEADSNMQRR
jgi:hypothetical protein